MDLKTTAEQTMRRLKNRGCIRKFCEPCGNSVKDIEEALQAAVAEERARCAAITYTERCTLLDAAGERDSIAALLADREEMTTYLKVEALQADNARLREKAIANERAVIDAVRGHWMIQGGEAQYGPIREVCNADEIVSEILSAVRAALSGAQQEGGK